MIEKILRHCGLWQPSTARAPPAGIGWVHAPDDEPGELTYVDIDTFEATF
ncbi:MAG: hypothetical protein WCJ35_28320 [Planctomycetota bacterium]